MEQWVKGIIFNFIDDMWCVFQTGSVFQGMPSGHSSCSSYKQGAVLFPPGFLTRNSLSFILKRAASGSRLAPLSALTQFGWVTLQSSRMFCVASMWWGGNIRSFFFLHKANRAARAAALTGWVPPHGVGPSRPVSWRSCRLVWVTAAERSWRCWFAVTVHAPARAHHIHNIVCVDRSPFNRRGTGRLLLCCLSPVWLGIQVKMRLVEGEMEFACCGEKEAWEEEEKKKHASSVCLFSDDGVDAVCVCSTCLAFISLTAVCLLHIV